MSRAGARALFSRVRVALGVCNVLSPKLRQVSFHSHAELISDAGDT